MDFLNIGTPELIVIALIGLLLFGPEDLLKLARAASGFLRSMQLRWQELSSQLSVELSAAPASSLTEPLSKSPAAEEPPLPVEPSPETGYGP